MVEIKKKRKSRDRQGKQELFLKKFPVVPKVLTDID